MSVCHNRNQVSWPLTPRDTSNNMRNNILISKLDSYNIELCVMGSNIGLWEMYSGIYNYVQWILI